MKIGLFGFGTVGQGLVEILRKTNSDIEVAFIVDRSYLKKKEIIGSIPSSDNIEDILNNNEIDTIVELIGGIDLPLYIIREAIDKKKHIITANKALIAEHGYSLLNKALEENVTIKYEAAVAGAIPVIENLNNVFKYDKVTTAAGILNGTSNYILTRMRKEKASYAQILLEAQKLGFAESDPSLDVGGGDACHKLAIIASLIVNQWVDYTRVPTRGIDNINLADISWAEKMGYRVRLLGKFLDDSGKNYVSVEPSMIGPEHYLWDVEYENNAVMIKAENSNTHLMVGKGAGSLPTAFSVFADLNRLQNEESNKKESLANTFRWQYARVASINEISHEFYIRIGVIDQAGVMAKITKILGDYDISIASIQQDIHVKQEDGSVDLVIVTHKCSQQSLIDARTKIVSLDVVKEDGVYMPIERVE